jgi:hypothetical protein
MDALTLIDWQTPPPTLEALARASILRRGLRLLRGST